MREQGPERAVYILATLLHVARREILQDFRPDSCIASTRVACDVLAYFGIEARPLVVRAAYYNRQAAEHAARIGRLPESPEETVAWSEEDGSWGIGIGYGGEAEQDPEKWAGHLVAIAGDRLLIDLSLDQADRPQHDIKFVPLSFRLSAEEQTMFLQPEGHIVRFYRGGILFYTAFPADRSFEDSPNWRSGPTGANWQTSAASARTIERIEQALRIIYWQGV